MNKTYIAIDLKSFYASVECVLLNKNPLTTNLVVADSTRSDKTICLAISPSLKRLGISGRPRLFEVKQKIRQINYKRKKDNNGKNFTSKTSDYTKINKDSEIDFIIAKPKMAKYIEVSSLIYKTYLKYISSDDIHVYSIDEVFIDATSYLKLYKLSAHDFAKKLIQDVLKTTKITATCGIGTNLYLAKVAMDILAKKMEEDKDGVRIAFLDEMTYRKLLWNHDEICDFWRIGRGIKKRLDKYDIHTMGDLARYSINHEGELRKEFGINAELIIDHAWGYESTTLKDIKNYNSTTHSISTSQVLHYPYPYNKAKIIVKEMADTLSLNLLEKHLMTSSIGLSIDYDVDFDIENYSGELSVDYLGRIKPKHSSGIVNVEYTSNSKIIIDNMVKIFESITNKELNIRRISVFALNVISDIDASKKVKQLSLFDNEIEEEKKNKILEKEKKIQNVRLKIINKYGKNSLIKASSLLEGATQKERNEEIGGHKA